MKTHLFLTPARPGTPGELVAMQFVDETPQFLEPVNPYVLNEKQLSSLRNVVAEAETALRHAKSRRAGPPEIAGLEKALTGAKRELDTVEHELRRKRQREQVGAETAFGRESIQVADKKNTGWEEFFGGIDKNLSANSSAGVCCSGKYLCARCQTKAAL